MLLREYQGERHTITVVANGYLWRETTYASLSTIARAITGTAPSGPRFWPLQRHERIFVRGAAPADQVLLTEPSQARRGSKIDWTSAAKNALLWVPAGGHGHPVKHLWLASRCAGLWVVRASSPAPRTNGAQTMSTLSIKSRNTKSAAPKKGSAQSKTASRA